MTRDEAEKSANRRVLPEKNNVELLTQMQNYRKGLPLDRLLETKIIAKCTDKVAKAITKLISALEDIIMLVTQYEAVKGACCDSSKT